MPFEKGQSGNPGGARIKSREQREFEEQCREWCRLFAFDKLKKRVDSKDEKISSWALEVLLNRAFGRAVETSVIDANVTQESGSSVGELGGAIDELVGSGKAKSGAADSPGALDGGK